MGRIAGRIQSREEVCVEASVTAFPLMMTLTTRAWLRNFGEEGSEIEFKNESDEEAIL